MRGMASFQPAAMDERREPRLQVLHRTRAVHINGLERPIVIVNVSSGGFMARGDGEWARGDRIGVILPAIGLVKADVRWALGGRIGCQLLQPLDFKTFEAMLGKMVRVA